MNSKRILALSCASLLLAAGFTHAQLNLNAIGGGMLPGNYGTLPGTTAFAKDSLAAGNHSISNLNDGIYGNFESWISNSPGSFAGLSFGATPVPIGQIAWGRDNAPTAAGYYDRAFGNYTVQYTMAPNPGAATLDTDWITIGAVTYETNGLAGSPISMSARHQWNFGQVMATGVRLIASVAGTCIDELEVGAFAPSRLTLAATGGTMGAGNLALSSAGAAAFARDVLPGYASHTIAHLNDGVYGNDNSWIGNSIDSFAGVRLGSAQTIDRIAFGRDNGAGLFIDRDSGNYLIQYTTSANPNETTSDWSDIGVVYYDPADPTAHQRHEYSFAPIAGVTGVRIFAPGDGITPNGGRAIDEIEVYAVPEPASATFLLMGAMALVGRRRRR